MLAYMRRMTTRPRPDWNRLGLPIPGWFRREMRRVDPRLVLQFIPPRRLDPAGIDNPEFPDGTWVVCRKLRHTGLLHKRWSLHFERPTREHIRMLRRARDNYKRFRHQEAEDAFDAAAAASVNAVSGKRRSEVHAMFAKACSRLGQRQWSNRVSMGQAVGG